jgi:hypothetical protein
MTRLPTAFDEAITIIPQDICASALEQARHEFRLRHPAPERICVMPILRGGQVFGDALGYPVNPIRMSYYRDSKRLPQPICLQKPDPAKMVGPDGCTLPVVLVEGVIETFSTIRSTVETLEQLCAEFRLNPPPYYEVQALVIKTPSPGQIPDVLPAPPPGTHTVVIAQFWVHLGIWIHGMGTDDGERGREVPEFRGRLSPFAESEPEPPYFTVLNPQLQLTRIALQ